MKKIYSVLIIFIFFFTVSNCNVQDKNVQIKDYVSNDFSENVNITLEKIRDFKIENTDEVSIDRIRDMVVVNKNEDRFAWVNEDKNEVFVTDTAGNHIYNFGSTGRGPSEFIEISSIGFNLNDDIVVYDAKQDLFKKFRKPGILVENFEGIIDEGNWPSSRKLYFINERLFFGITEARKSNPNNFWESKTIGVYDDEFKLVKNFGSFDQSLINTGYLYKFPIISVDYLTDQIFTTHRTLPYIQVFNSEDGSFVARFGIQSATFQEAQNGADISDPIHIRRQKNLEQSFVEEISTFGDYIYLEHSTYSEDVITYGDTFLRKSFINIFEKNSPYNFLGEIALEHIPLFISNEKKLFLLKDNNPDNLIVGVYVLNIEY